jgi:predicted kinase
MQRIRGSDVSISTCDDFSDSGPCSRSPTDAREKHFYSALGAHRWGQCQSHSPNLRLGLDVVADSCNPLEMTRQEWEQVAGVNESAFVNVEVLCSDRDEHRRRVESRISDIPGQTLPTWREVADRQCHQWSRKRIVIDTAIRPLNDCVATLMAALAGKHKNS